MKFEPVHIHSNRLNRNHNLFLFLIPIIIFAVVLALFLSRYQKQSVATIDEPSVLGEESPVLDKTEP